MTTIRAMVVGIDRYEEPNWNVDGPVASACDVARWLLELPDVTLRLDLFVDEGAALDEDLLALKDNARFIVHCETSAHTLNRFAREGLPKDAPPDSHLFFFWAGHGMICNTSDKRIFACGDYRNGRSDAFFNASNFVKFLHTAAFSAFSTQIVLADVCSVPSAQAQFTFESHEPVWWPQQLERYASLAGATAKTPTAGGTFVRTALALLGATPGYPRDLDKLRDDFDAAGLRADPSMHGGVGGSRTALFDSAWKLLDGVDAHAFFGRHYELTVADLGVPAKAHDLRSALQDLCEMRDIEGAVPHGLMQFLMRLATVKELSAKISEWLDREAKDQSFSRGKIADKLRMESRQRVLLVEVARTDGDIGWLKPSLCFADGSFDQSRPFDKQPVRGWKAFETAMHALLTEIEKDCPLDDMQIQFIVDLSLLDRPYHRLSAPSGSLLGQQACVVVRERNRFFSENPKILKKWIEYASSLRSQKPAKVRWIRIDDGPKLSSEQGLCFAGFSLPHPVEGGMRPVPGLDALKRAIGLGVPFLYIRHLPPPTPGEWGDVACALQALSSELGNLEDFVGKFHDERLLGTENALDASLLWDDPSFRPFTYAYER
ncbi:hypothetical protein PQR67_24120 [Paraburkholderia fungorum]|uniref:VMAP-C domain-containing protein n=1 Tax=Paraburkholderia fungorum TaxID=134537 RepID=UPI0038B873CA